MTAPTWGWSSPAPEMRVLKTSSHACRALIKRKKQGYVGVMDGRHVIKGRTIVVCRNFIECTLRLTGEIE